MLRCRSFEAVRSQNDTTGKKELSGAL
jgi:hypothetical protein